MKNVDNEPRTTYFSITERSRVLQLMNTYKDGGSSAEEESASVANEKTIVNQLNQ